MRLNVLDVRRKIDTVLGLGEENLPRVNRRADRQQSAVSPRASSRLKKAQV